MSGPTELATAYISLVPSMRGTQGEIAKQMIPDAEAAGDQAGERTGSRFAGKLKGILAGAAIGAAIVGSFAGLYKVGGVFDDVADTIRVGTGASGQALNELSSIAERVGNTVPTSFEDAGSTVADLNTRLGLTGGTLEKVSSQYIQAGNILGEDLDIQSTTAAFSAFGIKGDAVSGALDQLFQVSQATGVGMNDLAASVQKNAPAVQNLGFSFQDTAALAGSLDKAGLNTGQVMGALSKSLITLSKDGEKPADAFHRTVDELKGFIDAGDTASAINLAGKVFGAKGATQLVGAIQSGTLALDDLAGAAGLTDDTILGLGAETADFAESWTIVKNNALSALKPLGDAVFNSAGGGMKKVADLAQTLGPQVADGIGMGLDAIGPLFASLGSTLGPLIGTVLQLWQSFSPLSLIFKVIQPLLPTLLSAFTGLATTLGGALMTVLQSLLTALSPVVTILTSTLTSVLATLLPVIVQLATTFGGILASTLTTLAPILGTIAATLGSVLSSVLTALMPLVTLLAQVLGQVLTAVLPLIAPILGLSAALLPLLVPIISLVGALLTPLINLLVALLTPILALIGPLVTGLAGALGVVVKVLMAIVTGIVTALSWFINLLAGSGNARDQIASIWGAVLGFFSGLWDKIAGFFSGGIEKVLGCVNGLNGMILDALKGAGTWLLDIGKKIIGGLIQGIRNAIGGVKDLLGKLTSMIPDWKGPARVDAKLLVGNGSLIIQGLMDGISGQRKPLQGLLGDITNDIPGAVSFAPALAARTQAARASARTQTPATAATGAQGGAPVQMNIHPAPGMSEETIGRVAAASMNYELRRG